MCYVIDIIFSGCYFNCFIVLKMMLRCGYGFSPEEQVMCCTWTRTLGGGQAVSTIHRHKDLRSRNGKKWQESVITTLLQWNETL